ncbi:MAG: 30S ribosomal protein S20 [Clostridia bacterium]|nr:30S ribosomal protein S20 [Clostridia bacterium]MBQ1965286.1 30S ribosomal protein S20 [Clostridia bacterium]MBQ5743334.1 30S ribosomal protein S20 [Clostridia bacterium]
MPNIKSAKKRVLVNQTKNLQNKMQKSAFRTQLKALEADKSPENLEKAYSLVDKAAAKGLIHANCAARKKSRLAAEFAAE